MGNYVEFLNHLNIMKREVKMQDFWIYVAQIQKEVVEEVLKQVPEVEYLSCMKVISSYILDLRAMRLESIWAMNRSANKYIELVNEALKKRSILISEYYVHISTLNHQDHGEKN